MSGWTSPSDIAARVRRRWDDASLLRAYAAGQPFPVFDIALRGPTAAQIGDRLGEVQSWVEGVSAGGRGGTRYDVTHAPVGGRLVGRNQLPARAVVSSYAQAWALLGVGAEVRRFDRVRAVTESVPAVQRWVGAHPLKALDQDDVWPGLLAAYRWLDAARGRGVRIRQIDAPGVDTKFVERHRSVLAALLEVPGSASGFARELGLARAPETVRLRFSPGFAGLPASLSEATFRRDELARVRVGVQSAVVVENEATYLSVDVPYEGVVVWGKGFEVDRAGSLPWLAGTAVHYWGDLDTHGFAILDRLRAWLPQTRSVLMDHETLVAHRERWGIEQKPTRARLPRLDDAEQAVYELLVTDRLGDRIRLEQERIDWAWASDRLPTAD